MVRKSEVRHKFEFELNHCFKVSSGVSYIRNHMSVLSGFTSRYWGSLMLAGKGGAFIGGPTGPLLPFSNLDQFKDRPTFTGGTFLSFVQGLSK